MDRSNKENSEKVVKEAIIHYYVKKEYFSHIADKSAPLRRNSLKAFHVFIIAFVILVLVFISLAFHL